MTVRKLALGACSALAVSAASAFADGPGYVTQIVSQSPSFPYCIKFQTNNGPQWYGFSDRDPGANVGETSMFGSYFYGRYLSFTIGASNVGDCNSVAIQYASRIAAQ